jgi:hypothetical protein
MIIALRKPFTIALIGVFAALFLLLSFNITTVQAVEVCKPGTTPSYSTDANGVTTTTCDDQTTLSIQKTGSLTDVVGRVINIVLGFLGLIALILFIVGGFQWMTSGGNEEKTAGAKKLMVSAVIGLAIILGAAVISTFAFNAIGRSLGDSSAGDL